MSIARGLISITNVNVLPTFCIITGAPSSLACGDTLSFNVEVYAFSSEMEIVDGGTFDIIELNSGEKIATGTISSGTAMVRLISGLTGNIALVAQYNGVVNRFKKSVSQIYEYNISKILTTTTITSPDVESYYYCYKEPFTITAKVESVETVPSIVTTGNVQFIFVRNAYENETSIIIGESPLNGSGIATIEVPANTGNAGKGFITAYYLGENCFAGSYDKDEIRMTSNVTVSITIEIINPVLEHGITYYLSNVPIEFKAVITPDYLAPPSNGSVHFYATATIGDLESNTEIGVVTPLDGVATIIMPANTLSGSIVNNFTIYAEYHLSDSGCFATPIEPVWLPIEIRDP